MYDMTIKLQTGSDKHLYEQIYEHIRHEIREGRLLAGERLPSTRSMADYLQVARSTVDYAYDQLVSEGYMEARPYKGYFVCPIEGMLAMGERAKEGEIKTTCAQSAPQPEALYDFSPHGVDMSVFPFSVWRRITKQILSVCQRGNPGRQETARNDLSLSPLLQRRKLQRRPDHHWRR